MINEQNDQIIQNEQLMESKKNNKRNNKKPLIALLVVAIIGVIGSTFAYFTSTATIQNIFKTKIYKTVVTEEFNSPQNWTPGTETAKTVTATNSGEIDAAVRISYTESWTDKDGGSLPLTDDGKKVAIINFTDNYTTKWTEKAENGTTYYYYNNKLAPGASTTSLIKSVTFNPQVTMEKSTNCTQEGNTKTCTTESKGYSGGTYTLTIKVETVQFDQYKAAWGTNVEISNS